MGDTTVFRQIKQSTASFKSILGLVGVIIGLVTGLVTYISTQGQEKGAAGEISKNLVKDVERLVEEDHADEIEKVAEDVDDLFKMMNEQKAAIKDNKVRDEQRATQLAEIDLKLAVLIQSVEDIKRRLPKR